MHWRGENILYPPFLSLIIQVDLSFMIYPSPFPNMLTMEIIVEYHLPVLVLALDLVLIVEPAFGLPSRVAERGLGFLASAVTGTSAAATIIPIEMKAWTSSS